MNTQLLIGGTKNWGINVESGGQLLIISAQVSYCDRGIVLQGSSYCDFASPTAVQWWRNDGKSVDITHNSTGIYCGGAYQGTLIVNHTSQNADKMNFEYNTWGIFSEGHSGSITINNARMAFNGWAIYTHGNMNINNVNGAFNAKGIVNDGGTVNFNGGGFYSNSSDLKENGVYNASGTVNMRGGSVYNHSVGIWNAGIINMSNGIVGENTTGIQNYGTTNFTGGTFRNGNIGIENFGTCTMSGGQATGYSWGVRNLATFNISGGTINNNSNHGIVNQRADNMTGQTYMTGGNVTGNASYDIYHEKSDTDPSGAVYGGLRIERNDTVNSKIFLAAYNNYIYTGSNTPTITNITLGDVHLERNVIRTANTNFATAMNGKITVKNKGGYYTKANATDHSNYVVLWTNYTVTTQHKTKDGKTLDTTTKTYEYKQDYTTEPKTIEGYVLSETPSNSTGTTKGNTTVIYYYEEDANIAKVIYEDLLSGVVSAKYWYNANSQNFNGGGTNFANGQIFEDYGYYRVLVINGVGLQKEITFTLNKDSVKK